MYSAKSYYEITLMHLLNILSYLLNNVYFYLLAIANYREITQKKQRPSSNPVNIKTAIFRRNEKTTNRSKISWYYNVK